MPRPFRCRRVHCRPDTDYFKPRGIHADLLEEVNLNIDELEAIRLADLEDKYQEDAAKKMKISQPTFARVLDSTYKKVAKALIKGKAIKIKQNRGDNQ